MFLQVHQDRSEAVLQEFLWQLALQRHHLLEPFIRCVDHVLRLGVQRLEEGGDDVFPVVRVHDHVEVGAVHGEGQQTYGGDAEAGDLLSGSLIRRLRPDGFVLGLGRAERLDQQPTELLVELDDAVAETHGEQDRVDVADLGRQGQRAKRLVVDGREQTLLGRRDQIVRLGTDHGRDDRQHLLRRVSDVLVHVRKLVCEIAAYAEKPAVGRVEVLARRRGVAPSEQRLERLLSLDACRDGEVLRDVLDGVHQGTHKIDLAVRHPRVAEVDPGDEQLDPARSARLGPRVLPVAAVSEGLGQVGEERQAMDGGV